MRHLLVGLVLLATACNGSSTNDSTLNVRYVAPRPVPRVVTESVDPNALPVWELPDGQHCPVSYPIKAIKHIPRYDAWYYQPGDIGYDALWPDACYISIEAAYDAGYDPRTPSPAAPIIEVPAVPVPAQPPETLPVDPVSPPSFLVEPPAS